MVETTLFVIAIVVAISNFGPVSGDLVEGTNSRHFALLCRIYRVAADPPSALYDGNEVDKIRHEINVINASFADENWFSEISKSPDESRLSDGFKNQNGGFESLFGAWKKAVSSVIANKEGIKKLPETNPAVKLAQVKLKQIEAKVGKLIKDIEIQNRSAKLDDLKENFSKAIFGEQGVQGDATFVGGSNRETVCGQPHSSATAGTGAGKNLIMDFLCLCGKLNTGGNELDKACGTGVVTDTVAWNSDTSNSKTTGPNTWAAIRKACEEDETLANASATTLQDALSEFTALVEEGKATGDGATRVLPGLFGSCQGNCNGQCNGQKDGTHGLCVFYKDRDKSPSEAVQWLTRMKSGLKSLLKAREIQLNIKADITQLKILQARAEEIYEGTRATFELETTNVEKTSQSQNSNKTTTTPADKAIVQEHTAASIASIPRFIRPLLFLI